MDLTINSDSHQFASQLFDHLPVAVYTCDVDGYITYCNSAAVLFLGGPPQFGKDLWYGSWKISKPDVSPFSSHEFDLESILKTGIKVNGEELLIERQDGTASKVRLFTDPVYNSEGKLTGAVNTLIDVNIITPHEDKQAVLAAIVETSDDTIISKTLKGIITSWNRAAEQMFGYTSQETIGKHISILIPPDRLKEEEHIISQIASGRRVDHFETIRLAKNGRQIPISLSVSPIKNSSGVIVGASKIARDVTAQKEAKEALRRYTESLEIINLMVGTISQELDVNKILKNVTQSTRQLCGARFGAFFYNSVDVNGDKKIVQAIYGSSGATFKTLKVSDNLTNFYSTFFSKGNVNVDNLTTDNGSASSLLTTIFNESLPVVSYIAFPVVSRSGMVVGGLFLSHSGPNWFTQQHLDIVGAIVSHASTALVNTKLYEEIRVLNDKKDEFIGLASHELKTPLTSIRGYLQILSGLQTSEISKSFVSKTITQAKKLSALVSDLLDVSKIQSGKLQLKKEKFDVCKSLNDTIELVQLSQLSHQVIVNSAMPYLEIYGDEQRIEQVFINLLTNAIKYSPSADTVIVTLKQTDTNVEIDIQDFGFGIPDNQISQIFSRFYRVEDANNNISGLGIGLYISYEIIERHHGKLTVKSELGKGSTFSISIPLR